LTPSDLILKPVYASDKNLDYDYFRFLLTNSCTN